jgi:hypothetical protein
MGRIAQMIGRRLIHRCSIERRGSDARDGDGQRIPVYAAPVTGIQCRMVELTEQEIENQRQAGVASYTNALLVPFDTAIAGDDLIRSVTFARGGATVDDGPFEVKAVLTRQSNSPEFLRVLMVKVG